MVSNIPKLLTFIFFIFCFSAQAQEIWRESFSIQNKGIWGGENGEILSDFSEVFNWNLDYSEVRVSNADDYAKTVATSGGRFEVRDVEGEIIWYSEEIDISDYANVRIQLTAAETGSNNNAESKYLKAFYSVDNEPKLIFELNGENAGNWGTAYAEQNNLEGEKLEIIVQINNSYSGDKVILDEVLVTGEEKDFEPLNFGDIVINEVLFNPFSNGSDYVEIYNISEKEISLNRLYLASRDKDLELTQIYSLSNLKRKILPEEYLVLTKDTNGVFPWFTIKCKECFQQMEKFPSYNNDEDIVVLLDEKLQIIDELYYTEKLHSPMFADKEGVSLERISFTEDTNEPTNWHSASTASGYGTPGYENSQIDLEDVSSPIITFSPESFSPNFDGYNDEYLIHYELEQPGYIANAWIFDSAGRLVMKLAQNEILGTNGNITWNGEDETGQKQNIGAYIVVVEIFNTEGDVKRFKDGVVLTETLE